MNYKGLAAAVFLCVTIANISTPASAKQITSHSAAQFQPQNESTTMRSAEVVKIPAGQDNPVKFSMLDTICIVSLAVAGLVLLKRVQGE
jgi:DNA-binding Xre family transcriptional regulator